MVFEAIGAAWGVAVRNVNVTLATLLAKLRHKPKQLTNDSGLSLRLGREASALGDHTKRVGKAENSCC